ncbi:hypothetical protein SDJN02_25934, partial [Cucurbita argyrosperma subsp. argyrosperma]
MEVCVLPPGSDHFINYFPVLKQYECWHCLYAIFLSDILRCHPFFQHSHVSTYPLNQYQTQRQDKTRLKARPYRQRIDVDFNELNILEPCSKLLDSRLHVSTRCTPCSSEINHHLQQTSSTNKSQSKKHLLVNDKSEACIIYMLEWKVHMKFTSLFVSFVAS